MSRAGRPSAIVPDFEGGQQTLFGLARGEIKQSTPKVSARDAGRKAKRDAREKAKKEAAELAEHEGEHPQGQDNGDSVPNFELSHQITLKAF